MSNLTVAEAVEIRASPQRVWDVLTQPGFTEQYMFGCIPVTSWKVGGTIDWQGKLEGRDHVFVSGQVLACEAPSLLRYTTYDPHAAIPDPPAKRVSVTIRLTSPSPQVTRLDVDQGDYTGLPDAARRFAETREGWQAVLGRVKQLAEG